MSCSSFTSGASGQFSKAVLAASTSRRTKAALREPAAAAGHRYPLPTGDQVRTDADAGRALDHPTALRLGSGSPDHSLAVTNTTTDSNGGAKVREWEEHAQDAHRSHEAGRR